MKQSAVQFWAFLLALSILLSLAACGQGAKATSMHLRRTGGTVSVSDGEGKDVPVLDNLGLYSGYGVGTQSASYAWIDLDDVKLAKLDQNSEIAIQKEGKALDIEVKSGSLFFNVTEPLADDETMNIVASTMLVGIRGTCGWVENLGSVSRVYLLEGKVECSAGDQTVQVSAGEMARLTADGEITVAAFNTWDIPAFVQDEVDEDEGLVAEIRETLRAADEQVGAEVASGELGNNVTWTLRGNTLLINGRGEIQAPVIIDNQVDPTSFSWYDYREQIHTVIIGNGITVIGTMAFYECSNLTSVSIPSSAIEIMNSTFGGCNSLTSITIPDGVTSIGVGAFSGCSSLTSVTIPTSITSITNISFYNCASLTDVYYGGSADQWKQITILNKSTEDYDQFLNATIHYNSTGN